MQCVDQVEYVCVRLQGFTCACVAYSQSQLQERLYRDARRPFVAPFVCICAHASVACVVLYCCSCLFELARAWQLLFRSPSIYQAGLDAMRDIPVVFALLSGTFHATIYVHHTLVCVYHPCPLVVALQLRLDSVSPPVPACVLQGVVHPVSRPSDSR